MENKTEIVVKRISKPQDFDDVLLQHCSFWGLERGREDPEEIKSARAIAEVLKQKGQVFSVSTKVHEVPIAFLDVKVLNESRKVHVSNILSVKIEVGKAFRDNFLGNKLSPGEAYYETDLWKDLTTLNPHFKNLVNSENVEMLEKHGSNAIDDRKFKIIDEIKSSLPGWCQFVRDRGFTVDGVDDEPSEMLRYALELKALEPPPPSVPDVIKSRLLKLFRERPFQCIGTIAAVAAIAYFALPEVKSFSEKREGEREAERARRDAVKPVKGTLSIMLDGRGDEKAAAMLKNAAESFARDTIADVSGKTKAWRDGGKIELPANSWANVVTSVQKFAAESAGEFTCEAKGNDIVIFAHPEVVKSYTLDVDLLRTDAAAIGLVSKAFGVSFGGQTRLGPMPIRAAKRKTALKSLEDTQVKVEVGGDASAIVFAPNLSALSRNDPSAAGMTDAELSKKADAFWRDVAAEKFASLPKAHEDFRLRFSALDHEFTDGFEAAERDLAVLLDDIAQKTQECSVFLAECGAPWRQYSAAMPSDKNAKVRAVREALGGLESLKKSAQARYDRVSFDKDIAAFKKNREQFLFWGGEMIKVYNAQQARLAQMTQLRQNMANALNARSFSQMTAFESSIVERENAQRANRTREIQIGQYVSSICNADYFDQTFGQKWAKAVVRKYSAKVSAVDTLARQAVADFSSDVQRLFGAATLGKALDYGRRLSEAVVDNHKEARDGKTLSEMGAEVASVHGLRNDVAVLKRAQRKLGQR